MIRLHRYRRSYQPKAGNAVSATDLQTWVDISGAA